MECTLDVYNGNIRLKLIYLSSTKLWTCLTFDMSGRNWTIAVLCYDAIFMAVKNLTKHRLLLIDNQTNIARNTVEYKLN